MMMKQSSNTCEICGGDTNLDSVYFPLDDEVAMVHNACVYAEESSGNMLIKKDSIIQSLQLYCEHFGRKAIPHKVGDDEDA